MGVVDSDVRAAVQRMRPIDDAFFKHVAQDKGAVEEIVRAALGDESIEVESCSAQEEVDVVGRRSICADALCRTSEGRWVNVEAQVSHRHDDLRRARMHISLITVEKTPKGAEFKDIPDVAVVYLADYDSVGEGRLAYSYRMIEESTGEPGDFGIRAVLVNGTVRDGSALSRVMAVLCESGAVDFTACPRLSDRVEFIRNSEEARSEMEETMQAFIDRKVAEGMAEGKAEGRAEGKKQGLEQGRAELLADLVAAGVLSEAEAREWAERARP